jgi:hypothetical protein
VGFIERWASGAIGSEEMAASVSFSVMAISGDLRCSEMGF